jgi:hypothetical protein
MKKVRLILYDNTSGFLNNIAAGYFVGAFLVSNLGERIINFLYCIGCFIAANILDWLSKPKP